MIGIATIACACSLNTPASAQQAAQMDGDLPTIAARGELARLTGKTGLIRDVSATVLSFDEGRPAPTLTCRYFCSRELGLSRLEFVVPGDQSMAYLVDKRSRRVCAPIGKDMVALDREGSDAILGIENDFAIVMDVNAHVTREFYCVGTEVVSGRTCALFLCMLPGGGILGKLWVGLEDGILYKKEGRSETCVFQDVKVNTGLDKEFLGGNIASTNLPVVSLSEVNTLRRKSKGGK